jgi:N-acetylglucosamine-6-phosphate deacetylase
MPIPMPVTTLAPELPGAIELSAALRARGIAVSLGHSAADAETVAAAVEAGAVHVTHLFNAMGTLHHRAPGLIGAALSEDRLSVEVICDGAHVERQAVDIAVRCKPPGKLVLVSDAVAACSAPTGDFELFGTACVAGDAVRVKATGQLAGSCLTLDAALRRMHAWFPALPLGQCVRMATAAPAAVVGATDAGILAPGRSADVVVLTPALAVAATLCGGRVAHRSG